VGPVGWRPRSSVELILDQVRAIGWWVQDPVGHQPACAPKGGRVPRERRLDLAGELETLRATHAAVLARAELQLAQTGDLMWADSSCRAVLVHRDVWWRERVADCLSALGVQVIAKVGDCVDAVAVLVVEQPDLVVVQDLLPLLPGLQVVRQARRYAPTSLIAAHLLDSRQAQPFLTAGADVAFSRLDRPGEIAEQLVALLRDRPSTHAVH